MPAPSVTRRGLVVAALLAAAAVCAELAWLHARALEQLGLCGGEPQAHCGWCYAALGLALTGLAVVAQGRVSVATLRGRSRISD